MVSDALSEIDGKFHIRCFPIDARIKAISPLRTPVETPAIAHTAIGAAANRLKHFT